MKALGYTWVILWVVEENYRARKLYEKYEFRHDGAKIQIKVISLQKELLYFGGTVRLANHYKTQNGGVKVIEIIGITIVPFMMILVGLLWRVRTPKTINWVYGYRTVTAMKSQETWDFAHKYFGKLWLNFGIVIFLLTVGVLVIYRPDPIEQIFKFIIPTQLVFMVIPIMPTEIALRKNFDKEGKPR